MGAWGEENFSNDDAADWVWELERSKGINTLIAPIKRINDSSEYLESPECCEALAAAEVVAAGLTSDFSNVPEEVKNWLNKKQGFFGKKPTIEQTHANMAIQAITKIIDNSELKELWQDSANYHDWQEIQSTLMVKLKNAL